MELKKSHKKYNNYKSADPEATIEVVTKSFKEFGFDLDYFVIEESQDLNIFSGYCKVKNTPLKSNGKGHTPLLCKASAYAEIAERFLSGNSFRKFKFLFEREDLIGAVNIDKKKFDHCMNFAFLKGYSYNLPLTSVRHLTPESFSPVLERFSQEKEINRKDDLAKHHWVNGYSLSKKEDVNIPIRFLRKIAGSNGLASGNTLEEAITQATCELFERYCFIRILTKNKPAPTIDINTIENDTIHELIKYYNNLNIVVVIKDFSLGNRFPVIGVLYINKNFIGDDNNFKRDMHYYRINAGAALNLEEAIIRCLTENIQGRSREDILSEPKSDIIWNHWVKKMNKPYNSISDNFEAFRKCTAHFYNPSNTNDEIIISFNSLKSYRNNDFINDVHQLINICDNEGIELIVVNSDHFKTGLPSCRVLIPEMSWIFPLKRNPRLQFVEYSFEDSWFEEVEKIKLFINAVEKHLCINLHNNDIDTIFGKRKSLFEILAIANLKIENYTESLNCFLLVKELTRTHKFDEIVELLQNKKHQIIRQKYIIKNPLAHGWDRDEKIEYTLKIPIGVKKMINNFV